jgi:flavin-dependent dehydrogenase
VDHLGPARRAEDVSDVARLAAAEPVSAGRGSMTGILRLRRVYDRRVALVGDASGSVDAISGQGLTLAFLQAESLAGSLVAENLELYQRAHGRIMRRPMLMSRLLLSLDGRARLRRRVLRVLAQERGLFGRLLAIHAGDASPAESALNGLRLGWHLAGF